jgi:TatD DNase family protein
MSHQLPLMKTIDAHCHLTHYTSSDLDLFIKESKQLGIMGWIQASGHPDDWDHQIQIREKYGGDILVSFGLHPWWVVNASDLLIQQHLIRLKEKCSLAQCIGEIGLDLGTAHKNLSTMQTQIDTFKAQIDLAFEFKKPIILHIVKAHTQALEIFNQILKEKKLKKLPYGGIIHGFTGSYDIAIHYLKIGLLISIGHELLNSNKIAQTLVKLNLDQFVLETDANQTPNLYEIIQFVAKLKNVDANIISSASRINLARYFPISK